MANDPPNPAIVAQAPKPDRQSQPDEAAKRVGEPLPVAKHGLTGHPQPDGDQQ